MAFSLAETWDFFADLTSLHWTPNTTMKRILLILPLSAALLVPTYLLAQDHDQDNDDHHDDRHHVYDKHHKDYHDFDDHEDRDSSVNGAVFSRDESQIGRA